MRVLFTLLAIATLCLTATAQTETIDLDASVFFASASHEPNAAELDKLATFANQLTGYADYTLRIEAFTDEQGTDAYNEALAQRRAAAITRVLAQKNVLPTSSVVLTHGEQLARTNTTDDAERRNDRRVDLVATVVRWMDTQAAIDAARSGMHQLITIDDPTVRQTISGSEGGAFMIEPNSLVRPDGSLASGPVSIELIEAYDLSDMLMAGLTTTSDGRRLTTGGMLSLNATDADGAELALRKGASITSSIPTDDYIEEMRIFAGADHAEDGTPGDWQQTARGVNSSMASMIAGPPAVKTLEEYREEVSNGVERVLESVVEGRDFRYEADNKTAARMVRWFKANPMPKEPEYYDPNSNYVKAKPQEKDFDKVRYEPKGLSKVFMSKTKREEKTKDKRQRAERTQARRQAAYEKSVAFQASIPAKNQEMLVRYEQEMANWARSIEGIKSQVMDEESRRLLAIAAFQSKNWEKVRSARIAAMEDELSAQTDLTGQVGKLHRYFFSITQLGWANCDMFGVNPDPVEVLAALPGSSQKANFMLVPTDRRSVLSYRPGEAVGTWACKGIPRGVSYHVIAYEVINGQMVMAHQLVDAAGQELRELTYQPVAVMELKDKLADILGS